MARIIKQNKIEAIDYEENVRVTKMGNIIEVQQSSIRGKGGKIKKISKDEYIDTETGEIKKFNKHNRTSRKDTYNSLYQTFRKAKEIINSNFKGVNYTTWITLTYKDVMTDVKQFDKDFETFMKRIRRKFPNNKVKYITALEFSASGGFHCHCLLYWENKAPKFTDEDLASFWKKGFSYIKSLKNIGSIRNIGAYLTSHLTDMPLEEYETLHSEIDLKSIKTVNVDNQIKRIVKNARLELYPPNFRIFRHSNGMDKGDKHYMKYSDAMEIIENSNLYISYAGSMVIEADGVTISQKYEYFEPLDTE